MVSCLHIMGQIIRWLCFTRTLSSLLHLNICLHLPSYTCTLVSCLVKSSDYFDHDSAHSATVSTQANCLPPESLFLWRDSAGPPHMGLLAKLRPTINFPQEGPWGVSEMGPKYKMHQEIRMLNATHVAFCELLKFTPTSNIEMYIFNINI